MQESNELCIRTSLCSLKAGAYAANRAGQPVTLLVKGNASMMQSASLGCAGKLIALGPTLMAALRFSSSALPVGEDGAGAS